MLLKTKEHKTTLSEDISARVKVKVSKPEPDALRSLYGEPVIVDENDQEYFIVPAHKAQYTREVFPKYIVSEEFLPDSEINKLRDKSKNIQTEQPKSEESTQENPPTVKKRGNPNWSKKHVDDVEGDSDASNA